MSGTPAHTNRLAEETSPYLLQHAHNPVNWYPWGADALAAARDQDRPIFLSIGYSACHWCHVMERESFENEATAALLNREFIAIKVDREERPDLDDVYMAAVQAMTGGGGWPMSVFLTPDLAPFFGGTYFPPEDRHGLPGFPRLLESVAEAYRSRRPEIETQARLLTDHLRTQMAVPAGRSDPGRQQLEAAVRQLAASFDPVHGGFGGAPKFPAPMTLELLLRAWRRSGDPATLEMVRVTLDRMADGGINDQLGGGFARYATDARWLVPHFEKMLYDNALLAHAYLEAFRATGRARYAEVAARTLDFMLAELATDDGGFASALDADSGGEEGRYYVWTHDELLAVLADAGIPDPDRRLLAAYWDATPAGNWEGRSILHVAAATPDARLLERGREALLAARGRRERPGRDDKQLAAWNGMALRALAAGGLTLGEERFVAGTARLVAFIRRHLVRDGDRLWRTSRDGRSHTPGFAEDYANVADGLLSAYGALADGSLLVLARALVASAVRDFWDDASGTFADTSAEHDSALVRPHSLVDSATPSANAVGADLMLRLALLTGDEDLDRRARSILRAAGPALERHPAAFGRMLAAVDRAASPSIDAVVSGPPLRTLSLRRAVAAPYVPDLVLAPLVSGDVHAGWPLFAGKTADEARATAYVCRGYACDEPTGDPSAARAQVEALSRPEP